MADGEDLNQHKLKNEKNQEKIEIMKIINKKVSKSVANTVFSSENFGQLCTEEFDQEFL